LSIRVAAAIGWGGRELTVNNAGMSVPSDAVSVPEPALLLGLGLLGVAASRHKCGNK
jgi:hypothetical protein